MEFGLDEHFNAIEEKSYLNNHRAYYNPYLDVVF